MNTYDHVVRAVFGEPWAIREETLATIAELVRFRAEGGRLSNDEIQARLSEAAVHAGPRAGGRVSGAIAVIPVYGVIMPRASLMSEMSGGTSVAGITKALRAALADEAVGSIVLDVDSPGGQVGGIPELAAEIRAAREVKPIVAVANYQMASAAYWLASQATEVVASPSSEVGSIGVVWRHQEVSRAAEAAGITTTILRRPATKALANEWEPLTDEARADVQEAIDDFYELFTSAVAKGRGDTTAAVKNGYGKGKMLTAQRAKQAGLVDRVETLDDTIRRLAAGKMPSPRGARAEAYAVVQPETAEDAAALGDAYDAVIAEAAAALEPEVLAAEAADDQGELPVAEADDTAERDELELRRLKARAHAR